jgi:hypothetical protein
MQTLYWMLDAGCWMLDAGCWMLENCKMLLYPNAFPKEFKKPNDDILLTVNFHRRYALGIGSFFLDCPKGIPPGKK